MPRYRFSWDIVPLDLQQKLCSALGLTGEPADALGTAYGPMPKLAFVETTWPALLSEWLPNDDVSRQAIANDLKARGLGKGEIDTGSAAGQLEYLKSCTNEPTLRGVVLAAFLAVGEPPEDLAPAAVSPRGWTATTTAPERTNTDNLADWVATVLAAELGAESLVRDPDGDIPIQLGTSLTYVRVHDEDLPMVQIFAYLVSGLDAQPELYEAANEISLGVTFAKAIVVDDGTAIVLSAAIPADSLSPGELVGVLQLVMNTADHCDSMLQERFGGATALPETGEQIDV